MPEDIRKPTGRDGAISIGADSVNYLPIVFPKKKEDIELLVARQFAAFRSPHRLFAFQMLGEPTQNPTDDFDFTLSTDVGPKYLELMEVYLGSIGNEVSIGLFTYEPYRAAELLFNRMKKKSDHYRGATTVGIVLLIYATYWQFALSNTAIWILAHALHNDRLLFESVYYISLSDRDSPDVTLLYPTNVDFTGFDPEYYRANRDILFDSGNFQPLVGDEALRGVSWSLQLSEIQSPFIDRHRSGG